VNNIVAILGRPNVGKSTLFNRITGKKKALIHHMPGTTRDRNESVTTWKGKEFVLVDTGGWAQDTDPILTKEIKRHMSQALEAADVVLFLVDGKEGVHPLDVELNNLLRRHKKNKILVVNKIDNAKEELNMSEFFSLGIDEMIDISSTHGRNTAELLDKMTAMLPETEVFSSTDDAIKITLIGKPNVGKSSLFNRLCKTDRNIVNDKPGTTRDAIDVCVEKDGQRFVIIDTPGLHRKRTFKNDMEYLITLSAQRALERTDVAVILMDATQGVGDTESRVAQIVLENKCACLLAINKWDLIENKEERIKKLSAQLESKLHFLWWSKMLYLSAKTGLRTDKLLDEVKTIYKEFSREVPKDKLLDLMRTAFYKNPLSRNGKVLTLKDVYQQDIRPPTFVFKVNVPLLVHFSYKRYLENILRETFGFSGTPLHLKFVTQEKEKK
jgi:GTP-binding protein